MLDPLELELQIVSHCVRTGTQTHPMQGQQVVLTAGPSLAHTHFKWSDGVVHLAIRSLLSLLPHHSYTKLLDCIVYTFLGL